MQLPQLTVTQLEIRKLAAQKGYNRLLTFAHLCEPDPTDPGNVAKSRYQWLKHHSHIARKLEDIEAKRIRRLEIETPPRVGKSQICVRSFVPWYLGRHPDAHLIVVTATDDLATEHGRDIRDYLQGAGFSLVFGHDPRCQLRDDARSVTLLKLKGGGQVYLTGRGGLPAGVGGEGIIFDDFFKNAQDANSQTERDNAHRSFVADCQSRLNSDTAWIVEVGSRKHEDDVQGRQFDPMNPHYDERDASTWDRVRLPALAEADDPIGRAVDEPLWPQRFSFDHYNNKRNHASPVVRIDFQTQDQCKPIPEEGNYFKKEHLKTWKPNGPISLPDRRWLRFYCASDHALRLKQQNDSTVLLSVAIDPADRIFILPDTFWGKCTPDVMVEKMIDLMANNSPLMWWAARDQISGSIEPFLIKRMRERGVFRPYDDSITEATDLVQRARSIQARIFMDMVYFPAHWEKWGELEAQLLAFPNGKHDDFISALAMLGMGLDKMIKGEGLKPSNVPPKGSWDWHQWGRPKEKERKRTTLWV